MHALVSITCSPALNPAHLNSFLPYDDDIPLLPHNRISQARVNVIHNVRVRVHCGACTLVGDNARSNNDK